MTTLSEICIAFLTTLLAFFSLALLTALLYVLYRKQKIFQQHNTSTTDQNQCYTPSKELTYFFCCQSNLSSRVEPASSPTPSAPPEDEVSKWQQDMHGTCRGCDSEGNDQFSDKSCNSSRKFKRVALECFEDVDGLSSEARVVEIGDDDATPFSTPCASPPYYTPPPSPKRDESVAVVSKE